MKFSSSLKISIELRIFGKFKLKSVKYKMIKHG